MLAKKVQQNLEAEISKVQAQHSSWNFSSFLFERDLIERGATVLVEEKNSNSRAQAIDTKSARGKCIRLSSIFAI